MRKQAGFSLVEISIVLVIVGLMLGSAINAATVYLQSSRISAAQKALDTISRSITGFVLAKGRFPCPDSGDDGMEDCDGRENGFLPYVDLGTDKFDPWDALYRYAADTDYSDDPAGCSITFKTDDPEGDLTILGDDDVQKTAIAAIVYSTGPDVATLQDVTPGNQNFQAKGYDDIFVSISSFTIKADLAKAGLFPDAACP
jgi:prepilin-type N-terminal cleavage/methylation domain-containing protein